MTRAGPRALVVPKPAISKDNGCVRRGERKAIELGSDKVVHPVACWAGCRDERLRPGREGPVGRYGSMSRQTRTP
ncbi:MAG TPA: hypothetical protein VNM90_27480 [Haliangium sp.]|nr:hypothetical protein [Haliangium sp.]